MKFRVFSSLDTTVKVISHIVWENAVDQLAKVVAHCIFGHLDVLGSKEGMVAAKTVVKQVADVLLDDALEKIHDKHDLVRRIGTVSHDLHIFC